MFNSTILDVAIGLVFCFASVALFVSAVNEALASALKLRHKTLLAGIKQLLNDPSASGLVLKLYNHALVNPLSTTVPSSAGATSAPVQPSLPSVLPAYIPSRNFANALIDVIQEVPGDIASVTSAVGRIGDPQIRQLLQGFLARAQGSTELLQSQIADWFDGAMDRVSGGYKRRAQLVTFALGIATAAAFNIDSFYVLSQLWARPSLAAAVSGPSAAAMIAAAASSPLARSTAPGSGASASSASSEPFPVDQWMGELRTLPVGWDNNRKWPTASEPGTLFPAVFAYLSFLVGLVVTGSSAVFGAPFWFDLLQRLVQIRGTGAKPPADRDKDKPGVTTAGTP
jgi:hypothetical protein